MTQQPPPADQPPQSGLPSGWGPPPGWGAPRPQPPWQPPVNSGRIVAYVILGGLLGMFVGLFVPFLPGLLAQVFFGADVYSAGASTWLGLAALVTVPLCGILGALWGMRRAKRWRQRPPIDPGHYPNRIVDVRRSREE
jgi:hypothetical protein